MDLDTKRLLITDITYNYLQIMRFRCSMVGDDRVEKPSCAAVLCVVLGLGWGGPRVSGPKGYTQLEGR